MRPAEYRRLDLDERVEAEEYLSLVELKDRDRQRAEREYQEKASKNADTKRRIEEQEARLRGEDGGPPAFPRGRRGKR